MTKPLLYKPEHAAEVLGIGGRNSERRPMDGGPRSRPPAVRGPRPALVRWTRARVVDHAAWRPPRSRPGLHEEPKSERSRRTLALPTQLVDDLRTHRAEQLEERMAAANALGGPRPGVRAAERAADRQEGRLARLAGSPDRCWRPHRPTPQQQRTAATLLLSAGVHPRVVMEVLGHAQMRTTMGTYSHVMPALGRCSRAHGQRTVRRNPATHQLQWPPRWHQKRHWPPSQGRTARSKGGAEGTRTPDPHTASVVRYQLRHSPLRPTAV